MSTQTAPKPLEPAEREDKAITIRLTPDEADLLMREAGASADNCRDEHLSNLYNSIYKKVFAAIDSAGKRMGRKEI